ncbi:FIP1[V]-like protein [Impatiens glandulifera]|uniref:FIP1[V]-like protein n=1 Tax=Impatiens glandulifera TaxID=253017 RepID=UPI001FB07B5F|nr:FIP1[V]-like protein [Impatiens glandulifera]
MEEDDEFGDLYTDVLRPLQPPPSIPHKQPDDPFPNRPVDLNLDSDDEEIPFGVPISNHTVEFADSQHTQVQGSIITEKLAHEDFPYTRNLDGIAEDQKVRENDVLVEDVGILELDIEGEDRARVLDVAGDVNLVDESRMEVSGREIVNKDEFLGGNQENIIDSRETYEKFDIEDVDNMDAGTGTGTLIPGLSIPGVSEVGNTHFVRPNEASGEGDDWDSDSDDDLQIVLNDNNHGNALMDKSGEMGSDDEDEDGEPLVIVGDTDQVHLPMEEPDWGEDVGQAVDGDKKEFGDVAKPDGMIAIPKVGYSSHVYHPYHSQFKYVRPGAAPMPGAASVGPGGVLGQVRPPVVGMPPSGRGRGDWRPSAMKNGPNMQKGFHAGFGMPPFSAGRGFGGGLDFTLPSHKTVFEVDVDSFEEKPWKLPGIDISDYFNFGLNEESWKEYCKQLEQYRMETTMQSKIRVYESGRAEQEYDPDLPPELAAAAGLHTVSTETANVGKVDGGQSDLVNGSARLRPPLPMGRPIQVETGHGERFPSVDTRPARMRDSDAIIEIVLQDSVDDDSLQANDAADLPENDNLREDLSDSRELTEDTKRFPAAPHDRGGRKREERSGSCTNSVPDDQSGSSTKSAPKHLGKEKRASFSPEGSIHHSPETEGRISPYSGRVTDNHLDRCAKERPDDRSPNVTPSDSQKEEESTENIDGKHSLRLSSPTSVSSEEQQLVDAHEDHGIESIDKEGIALDATVAANIPKDQKKYDPHKRQKVSSHTLPETDDVVDFRAARSSENSKARSGSSRDLQQKLHDGIDEEVVQHRNFIGAQDVKRPLNEEEQTARRKGKQDTHFPHRSHLKTESSVKTWQQHTDEDLHGRRKRERVDDVIPRHRPANERYDKDEHLHSRKQLDNGTSRVHREREVASRYKERDDNLKGRYEIMDDLRGKRRKEEEYGNRENYSSHKKRDRVGDIPDLQRRDGKGWIPREREDWHRIKQLNEDGFVKRERDDGRGGIRSSLAKGKDGFKNSDREYPLKDIGRHSDLIKRRDHNDDAYPRGSQISNDERRSRQESANGRDDFADGTRTNDKKLKETTKKRREYKSGDQINLYSSVPNQEQIIMKNELEMNEGARDGGKNDTLTKNHQSSRKRKGDPTSEDEQQLQDSKRGRSKMERWTSHKERDLKDESSSRIEEENEEEDALDSQPPPSSDLKDAEINPLEDTVAKLKKRSERFKLPMTNEKESTTLVNKIESEPSFNPTQGGGGGGGDNNIDSDFKPERPARKRRWTGN